MFDHSTMSPFNFEHTPTQIGTDEQFAELTKGCDYYLDRLHLYTKGKAVAKRLIPSGHYGIPESGEKIIDLDEVVDVLPLARRAKAVDMSDTSAILVSYDIESKEFTRIMAEAAENMPHRQYGVSFLVYERTTRRYLEFFCGNWSNRVAARKVLPFLPLTEGDIDAMEKAGKDVSGQTPHGPIPMTLTVALAENRYGSWHVPDVAGCSMPFISMPSTKSLAAEIMQFVTMGGKKLH